MPKYGISTHVLSTILGIVTSLLSLTCAFFNFYISLPTEEEPLETMNRSIGQKMNNIFIAFTILLCAPCILVQMSMILTYTSWAGLPIFCSVGFLTLFTNPYCNFDSFENPQNFKYELRTFMTSMFVPHSRTQRKIDLIR